MPREIMISSLPQDLNRGTIISMTRPTLKNEERITPMHKGEIMKRILPFIICGLLIPIVAADWPMFMHDEEHTGFTDTAMENITGALWHIDLDGRVCSSPVIVDSTIYIGSENYLYALDHYGNTVWKKEMNVLWASPAVRNGRIYVPTWDGHLLCLTNDGEILWDQEVGKEIRSSPLVYRDRVFIGADPLNPTFYCIDANTGEIQWSHDALSPIKTSAAAWNDRVYIVFQNDIYADELCCFDLDGNLVWTYKTADVPEGTCVPEISIRRTQFVTSSPMISDGRIYFGAGERAVHCVDAETGERIWTFTTKASKWMKQYRTGEDRIISTPSIMDGKVYFGSWNNTIYCLDAGTGQELWSCLTGDRVISSPVLAEGMAYIGCMDGHFYRLDGDGNVVGDFNLGKVLGSPAIADGRVFVPAESILYCLGHASSEPKTEEEAAEKDTTETTDENGGGISTSLYYVIGAVIAVVVLLAVGMKKR
jgi:outer membrane protein assembly factor BamB